MKHAAYVHPPVESFGKFWAYCTTCLWTSSEKWSFREAWEEQQRHPEAAECDRVVVKAWRNN